MKSEGFCVLATKKKNLVLHVYWITNKKERRMHDFGFLEEGVFFLSWLVASSSFLSFFLNPRKP